MVVNALYFALLIGNAILIVVALLVGPRLLRFCRVALLVNGIALAVMVVPTLSLLLTIHAPPEYPAAVKILQTFTAPILAECLVLLAILRWRRRPR